MRRILFLFSIVVISTIGAARNKNPSQQFLYTKQLPATFHTERLQRIDSVFQSLVDRGIIPHAVTFVAHKGQVVHHKAYGWRDIENKIPCHNDDIFRMASQTKAITAVAVLMLMEEGKIQLDEPIKKYIPEFANPTVLMSESNIDAPFVTRPAKRDVTIRDLLTHTSGIAYNSGKYKKMYTAMGVPTSPLLSLDDITLGEVVRKIAKCPLNHDPGEGFTYGMSVDVLGYLIEVISGKTIDVFFKERIFEPLGMNSTFFYLPKEMEKRIVTLYKKEKDAPLTKNNIEIYQTSPYAGAKKMLSTGAGLNGTIEDYAKFCQMILNEGEFNGKRILSRKTVEMMGKNAVGDLHGEIGWGLAFEVFRYQYSYRSIASEGSLHWSGMFGTDYIIDPAEDLILIFYVNLNPNNSGTDLRILFRNLVYQALK